MLIFLKKGLFGWHSSIGCWFSTAVFSCSVNSLDCVAGLVLLCVFGFTFRSCFSFYVSHDLLYDLFSGFLAA